MGAISHSWEAESIEQKARWFQSLSLEERMELFCQYTDLLLALNPEILEQKKRNAQPVEGRVLVVTQT